MPTTLGTHLTHELQELAEWTLSSTSAGKSSAQSRVRLTPHDGQLTALYSDEELNLLLSEEAHPPLQVTQLIGAVDKPQSISRIYSAVVERNGRYIGAQSRVASNTQVQAIDPQVSILTYAPWILRMRSRR
jgi:hypothetical protein